MDIFRSELYFMVSNRDVDFYHLAYSFCLTKGRSWQDPAVVIQDSILPTWKFHELSHRQMSPPLEPSHIAKNRLRDETYS